MLVSVDPGVTKIGMAVFKDNVLISAHLIERATAYQTVQSFWELVVTHGVTDFVCEKMQGYAPGQQKGDQNDLLEVNLTVGRLANQVECHSSANVHLIYPRVWKKQVPKEIMCTRIEGKLSDGERAVIPPKLTKKERLDVLDAIGIGLWRLGRL